MGIRESRRVANRARIGVLAIAWMASNLAVGLTSLCGSTAHAQGIPTSRSTERRLAPDALIEIAPAMQYGETFQGPIDLPLVINNPDLAWDPFYAPKSDTLAEMARDVVFRVRHVIGASRCCAYD